MSDETPSQLPEWEKGVISVILLLALIGGIPALGWLWFSDPERVREDVSSLSGVSEVTGRDGTAEVRLAPEATIDEIATALEEADRYREALDEADEHDRVVVRSGEAVVQITSWAEPVEPALLRALGSWPATDGIGLTLRRGDNGHEIQATAATNPSVSTLLWISQQALTLDSGLLDSVWLFTADEEGGVGSMVAGEEAIGDLRASTRLLSALAGLADLDPEVVVATPDRASVRIETGEDRVDEARRRAARALRAYPRVKVHVSAS